MTDRVPLRMVSVEEVTLDALPSHDGAGLTSSLQRVLRRVESPGASISGYNGAGGLSGDVDVDISGQLR